jgi:cobalt-zinc-cadmium efflux system protein
MDAPDHDHHDHHDHPPARFDSRFAAAAALNLGLVVVQVIFGFAANSVALLADAVHNLGDVAGLLLAWGAVMLSRRAPSQRRTYGWGRSSILAALVNSVVLLLGIGAIAVEAVQRLLAPQAVDGGTVMWVAAAAIVVNGLTAWMFSHGHEDLNIRATFLHLASDAAVSVGVLVSDWLIQRTGRLWLDPLASLAIVAVLSWSTWRLLRDALDLAMDAVPRWVERGAVEDWLRGLPGVADVHDLHIWAMSTTEAALTAHLVRHAGADEQALIERACHGLGERFRIHHATLQVEDAMLAETCRLRPMDVV